MSDYQKILQDHIAVTRSLGDLEPAFQTAVQLISGCLNHGKKLLICGNGGSAADASHLATEFVIRFMRDRRPLPAITLTDSGSALTAAGNDYGFDEIFARQVGAFGQPGDVLIALTTSGRSPNILRALEQADQEGVQSVALLGRGGGSAKGRATVEMIVNHDHTARIQEAHHLLIHALCEQVEQALASAQPGLFIDG